jgi:hypothetical protein
MMSWFMARAQDLHVELLLDFPRQRLLGRLAAFDEPRDHREYPRRPGLVSRQHIVISKPNEDGHDRRWIPPRHELALGTSLA